ncbi:MAG: 16S rRNA (cytosine(1402)-N(4))-methyltransferase RsmH [Spirochaetia bacterium]|nr:16S rRNA (cytosine(1402)-N(4))-methyltransferase RsmH [Spirochaetia bacterium]
MNSADEFHYSVLLESVIEFSDPLKNISHPVLIDATLGAGGHAISFAQRFPDARIYAFDRDPDMIEKAQQRIVSERIFCRRIEVPSPEDSPGLYLLNRSFGQGAELFLNSGISADFILMDLGVSIHHFRDLKRGFSYTDEILDMRLSPDLPETAADILKKKSEEELSSLFSELGEEKFSGRIARSIKENLPILSARHLAEVILKAVPGKHYQSAAKIHPATRVFQALRIHVNHELEELNKSLKLFPEILNPGGRLAVISFHSLEDRMVKLAFKSIGRKIQKKGSEKREKYKVNEKMPDFTILTSTPVIPGTEEIKKNPPSRSAKLRVIEKKLRK